MFYIIYERGNRCGRPGNYVALKTNVVNVSKFHDYGPVGVQNLKLENYAVDSPIKLLLIIRLIPFPSFR